MVQRLTLRRAWAVATVVVALGYGVSSGMDGGEDYLVSQIAFDRLRGGVRSDSEEGSS